jgi:hypothetical protein
VKTLLNVSDSDPADTSQLAQPQNESTIQEVEEELEVEKGEKVP